jgi:hypothetical protein
MNCGLSERDCLTGTLSTYLWQVLLGDPTSINDYMPSSMEPVIM